MTALRLSPVFLSTIVLAAHFLRSENIPAVVLILALPFLLLVKRPWVVWLYQAVLALGAIEWIRTLVMLKVQREALGVPWIRMAVILGVVAAVTAGSALVFLSRSIRQRYGLGAA